MASNIVGTAWPRVFLGSPAALADASARASHGLAHIVCVGRRSVEEESEVAAFGLPCSRVDLAEGVGEEALAIELSRAAAVVEEALLAPAAAAASAARAVVPDCEPGESSEEEGGSSGGTRMRVRISRAVSDERWGISWHKDLFKKTHRLVVDEVVEGSLMARWNATQPLSLQVRYGDRLVRVNGVSTDDFTDANAKACSAKQRAELLQDQLRALFFRPGSSGGADEAPAPPQRLASSVFLCGLAGPGHGASSSTATADEATAAATAATAASWALRHGGAQSEAQPLASALRALARQQGFTDRNANAEQAVVEEKVGRETAPEAAQASRPARHDDTDGGAEGEAAAAEEVRGAGAGAAEDVEEEAAEREAQWTYSCHRCSSPLFHDLNVLPHNTAGVTKSSRKWNQTGASEGADGCGDTGCTSIFVEPMQWMGDLEGQTGRLLCGNQRCKQKLGAFSWHGLPCSCGQWQSPAFQMHCAKIDCLPSAARRRARGPAPQPVFVA